MLSLGHCPSSALEREETSVPLLFSSLFQLLALDHSGCPSFSFGKAHSFQIPSILLPSGNLHPFQFSLTVGILTVSFLTASCSLDVGVCSVFPGFSRRQYQGVSFLQQTLFHALLREGDTGKQCRATLAS